MRLDGVGDALACTPLVAALRAAGHTLGIALSDRNAGIFARDIFVAEHVLERIPWPKHGSTPASRARARAEISAQGYAAALIVSEEPEAYELARSVPQRIGFTTGWAKPLKSLWIRRRITHAVLRGASVGDDPRHEVEAVFALGAPLVGASTPSHDAAVLRPIVVGECAMPPRTGIVMQLGPKWTSLGVPAANVRAIASALAARGARVVASAGEAEAARALAPDVAFSVTANLETWKSSIDAARVVVTPDTGAAHLAGMLGVACIDVFADADAAAQIARWRPWASRSRTLVARELAGDDAVSRIEAAIDAV